jgi:hypothetical protein
MRPVVNRECYLEVFLAAGFLAGAFFAAGFLAGDGFLAVNTVGFGLGRHLCFLAGSLILMNDILLGCRIYGADGGFLGFCNLGCIVAAKSFGEGLQGLTHAALGLGITDSSLLGYLYSFLSGFDYWH